MIDTHAHLYWDSYKDDLDQVIKRSLDADVTTIINVGVDVELSKKALEQVTGALTNTNLKAYSTIGIHPHEAQKYAKEDIQKLEAIYRSNPEKVVAVGECGLDYQQQDKTDRTNRTYKRQKALFQAQIDLAKKLNLPLIIHCREAWDETLRMTKDWYGIYHCYSGLPHNTKYIIHHTNFLISFAANVTYPKNEYLREAVKMLPLDRMVLETDCPFLPPQSKRGQRNEPANTREIAQLVASLKEISLAEVSSQTTKNVKIMFRLNLS